MTRSIIEAWGRLVKWPSKHDAHSWLRSSDRPATRPTGRVQYGYNRVQEIVSGTGPNYYLPVDRRTLIPLFQFLPLQVRAYLLHVLPITSFGRLTPYYCAYQWASAIRNLTFRELRVLFPEATIASERVLGFTKSFMIIKGFDDPSGAFRLDHRNG